VRSARRFNDYRFGKLHGSDSSRPPIPPAEFKFDCAGFVLLKKLDPPSPHTLRPFLWDSLLLLELARRRDD
jgi:hypothetical protein